MSTVGEKTQGGQTEKERMDNKKKNIQQKKYVVARSIIWNTFILLLFVEEK